MALYIGLDVHQHTSTLCVLERDGHLRGIETIKGRWPKLIARLKALASQEPIVVAYEASLGYGTLYDQLARFCQRVVVAHPGRLRLIFKSKRKNDRIDAKKIATLLFLDELPQVHVPRLDVREWRRTIEFRTALIHKRTRCKNQLRSLLRTYAIASPPRTRLWTKKGRAWLAELELPSALASLQRNMLMKELAQLDEQIKEVTKELDAVAKQHPGVALLQSVPGIGPRTAEAFVAYVDDPHRFAKVRRIGAYLGLVPCQDASASVNRLGHVTKEGPATLRRLLVEAAWRAIDKDAALRQEFDRITGGKRDRRKIAVVAIGHKLARIMLAMLRTGSLYESRNPQQEKNLDEAA